jgi:hypothetical protein
MNFDSICPVITKLCPFLLFTVMRRMKRQNVKCEKPARPTFPYIKI